MSYNFNNKRALVTGGARGIGKQIVKQLLESNTRVIVLSKTKQNLDSLKVEFPTIETICVDVSDWQKTKTAIESIEGDIDMLVNNAGYGILTKIGDIDEKEVDDLFDTNVKSVINITQIIVGKMKSRGTGGSIVNISSIAGMIAIKDHLVYGASKAALDLMTKILAMELGPFNIRVNSVNPSVTWTDMAVLNWSAPERRDPWLQQHPLGRFNRLEDVANAVLFLLSENSNTITGTILPIDSGRVCH